MLLTCALVAILSGIAVTYQVSDGFSAAWMQSPPGATYLAGGAAALLAALIGGLVNIPAAARLVTAPPPLAARLVQRIAWGTRTVALLLLTALLGMSVARYL